MSALEANKQLFLVRDGKLTSAAATVEDNLTRTRQLGLAS